jgi:hypothetical protein
MRAWGIFLPGIVCWLSATAGHAGPRASASYSIAAESADAGGGRATSTSYTNDASAGGITGISNVAAPAGTAKAGYLGQLYEVTALQLAATPTTVNETATRQLGAALLLDDGGLVALPPSVVAWSVASGPLGGINSDGLVTAATVYQDSAATARGDHAGTSGTLGLTVLDTLPDNFGTYAGDGLADNWQFQYFGLDNPLAAPRFDTDGDGQDNAFEFAAGLVPTDPLSRFTLSIAPVPSQAAWKQLVLHPIVPGRGYTVLASLDPGQGSWIPLAGASVADQGAQRTVTDLNAGGTRKFYKVEIAKP